jgi:hypothetical protein
MEFRYARSAVIGVDRLEPSGCCVIRESMVIH